MSGGTRQQQADLDLDAIVAPAYTFRKRGIVYPVASELAIETIVEALQLRDKFRDAEQTGDEDAMVTAMNALRDIAHDIIRDGGHDGEMPRLSIEDVTAVIGLAMEGPQPDRPPELERAARDAITDPDGSRPPTRTRSRAKSSGSSRSRKTAASKKSGSGSRKR